MSDEHQRIEIITGNARRRCWTVAQKLRMVAETWQTGESISGRAVGNLLRLGVGYGVAAHGFWGTVMEPDEAVGLASESGKYNCEADDLRGWPWLKKILPESRDAGLPP